MTMHILAFFRLFLSLRKSFLKVTQQSKRIKLVSFCCALLENPLICFTVFFYFFFSLAGMFKGNNQFPTPKSKSFLVFCCIFSILMLVSCFFLEYCQLICAKEMKHSWYQLKCVKCICIAFYRGEQKHKTMFCCLHCGGVVMFLMVIHFRYVLAGTHALNGSLISQNG